MLILLSLPFSFVVNLRIVDVVSSLVLNGEILFEYYLSQINPYCKSNRETLSGDCSRWLTS